jgi:hypothetical protein
MTPALTEMPRSRSIALQPDRAEPPVAAGFDLTRESNAPPNSNNLSVNVVLPAPGCEMIANLRHREISSIRLAGTRGGRFTSRLDYLVLLGQCR